MFDKVVNRRGFLVGSAAAGASLLAGDVWGALVLEEKPWFEVSLAEWSLHRTLGAGTMTNLDFPRVAREVYGIGGIEYVNSFFKDKARDEAYLKDLKKRCGDYGVTSVLIMCDGEGAIGDPDAAKRAQTVENHHRWVECAKYLGCHSIRVNAQSSGSREEQAKLCADGLARLGEYGAKHGINVIVENHGGLSSMADWLVDVMKRVDMPNVGTLPDFGNFYEYSRYKGTREMMPFAKAVSAKSHAFDAAGNETTKDFEVLMKIVKLGRYRGWVGIEYEGSAHSEEEGIKLTKRLLDRLQVELAEV